MDSKAVGNFADATTTILGEIQRAKTSDGAIIRPEHENDMGRITTELFPLLEELARMQYLRVGDPNIITKWRSVRGLCPDGEGHIVLS